jgi:GMP synthase (glutamine-hydrolysing)
MKILLLQARQSDDPAKAEERASFAQKAGLPLGAFASHDLLTGPPTLQTVQQYDALMVGGSGAYYLSKRNLPKLGETLAFFRELVDTEFPTLASCFGFHLMTVALGGQIIFDPDHMELGTYDLTLTPAGQEDELLGSLPLSFRAQLGHQDRAAILPEAVINLASSAICPYQAFRLPGMPIWATQFHPELTGDENRTRYQRYLDTYSQVLSPEEKSRALERFTPSPDTPELIPRFLKLIQNFS